MAITRAQQAKQMLQNGGRIGLRFGNRGPGEASRGPQGPAGGASAGGNYGGNRNPSQDYGGRDTSDDFGQFERRQRQNQELQGAGFLGKDLGMNIGEQDRLAKLGDVIGGLPLIRLLRSLPQGTRPVITPVGGGGDSQAMATIPMWMQLGFNSEAEYLASLEQDEDKDKEAEEGLRIAFRADGGRIGLQEGGGIEQRLEKLGGDVSSAEQMLQGINQRLKTAESSLGSGSMEGLGSLQQPGIIPGGIKLPEISGNEILPALDSRPSRPIGIRPDFNATIDPNFKPVEELKAVQPIDPLLTESRERIFNKVPEEFRAGFAEFAKGRPIGFGGQAISYVGLPGGGSVMFGDTGSAGTFRDYLSSIGFTPPGPQVAQLPAQRGLSGIPAAGYADGGNVVGGEYDFESARQMYGLGKLVKKVTRTVKKIAKSPIGKAAIIGAGIYGLGGGFGAGGFKFGNLPGASFFGKGSFNPLLRKVGGDFAQSAFGSMISGIPGGGVTAAIAGSSLLAGLLTPEQEDEAEKLAAEKGIDIEKARRSILAARREQYMMDARARGFKAEGGPAEGKEPVAKKTMPLLDMGGQEMDLRAEGGFVPIGRMEKADDVPARLSKNEFVFTADAVRNAGEGDVDKGAEVMYNMMKNLEAGGEVSEESQGLKGARKMFQTSQRLEEVL
jgi:hypothetical protein